MGAFYVRYEDLTDDQLEEARKRTTKRLHAADRDMRLSGDLSVRRVAESARATAMAKLHKIAAVSDQRRGQPTLFEEAG